MIASTYELIGKLGSGGGGNVYLARHLRLKKYVVLKIDKRKLTTSEKLLRREVDVLKELSHPYIPQVYDFFVEGEKVYTVMDYIEGESLDKALKRGERFSQPQVIQWALQLLDALCYLHSPTHGDPPKGFVHSDIKPANLMRTPQGDICLIDFNIALALGEENVIGCSAGYASPEHYGLDFSREGETETKSDVEATLTLTGGNETEEETETIASKGYFSQQRSVSGSSSGSSYGKRIIIPDIRSDIYSVGATLYHLLAGKRPSKNAKEVVRLSEQEFSRPIVEIISRAMNPNPDLRYQTARAMRKDFLDLRKNDPRMRKWKRRRRTALLVFPVLFVAGGLLAFAGLKGMQMTERWQNLTEHSQNVLEEGDVETAVKEAMQVLSESQKGWASEEAPGAQKALTEALGVYDLQDSYKAYKTLKLPSPPLYLKLSPDGKSGTALRGQKVVVFHTDSAEITAELTTGPFALSEIEYLNNDVILYAGEKGIQAYDIKRKCPLWTGNPAASICVSDDGKYAAGIGEDESFATVYNTESGQVRCKIDFQGKKQNPALQDNLFCLNQDGSRLGVSFEDGSLLIYDLEHERKLQDVVWAEQSDLGYIRFQGGFCNDYFVFAASDSEKSAVVVMNPESGEQLGGFEATAPFGVEADTEGIYVQSENILVKLDPVTEKQTPLVTMDENILRFAVNGMDTMATTEKEVLFFNPLAQQTADYHKKYSSDLVDLAEKVAVLGSMDEPVLRFFRYENYADTELFTYDPSVSHDEARVSADGETVMLYSYRQFQIFDRAGKLVQEVVLPNAEKVIDQQFVRGKGGSYLAVIYADKEAVYYSAKDGSLSKNVPEELRKAVVDKRGISEEKNREDNTELDEEFFVGQFRIESPLHGTPVVYNAKTGKEITRLKEDAYLTDVTQSKDFIVAQFITADGYRSGQLLNQKCEVLAELPYLSDVVEDMLIFDYPTGSIRETKIYTLEELMERVN